MPNPNQTDNSTIHNWTEIAEEIQDGHTVLVLGPNAIPLYPTRPEYASDKLPASGISFSQLIRHNILENNVEGIRHYYKRDNLFLFEDDRPKRKCIKIISNTVKERQWLPDTDLLKKIVEMPFSVVMNLNPDKYLFEAFSKYYHTPQFNYYSTRHRKISYEIEEEPDCIEKPLIYNLCGSIDDINSLILDHFDLFELLKNLLNDEKMPTKLSDKLRDADRFVLLGFELERWYFQLFLMYINRRLENEKGAFSTMNHNYPVLSFVGEDSKAFVMKQFNIKHFSTTREDFNRLYEECKQKKQLRKIKGEASPIEVQLRLLIAQNKVLKAFQVLESQTTNEGLVNIDIPHLKGRYISYLEKEKNKLANSSDLEIEKNRIVYTLLTFAAELNR